MLSQNQRVWKIKFGLSKIVFECPYCSYLISFKGNCFALAMGPKIKAEAGRVKKRKLKLKDHHPATAQQGCGTESDEMAQKRPRRVNTTFLVAFLWY